MAFLVIDQGNPLQHPYKTPQQEGVSPVLSSHRVQAVAGKEGRKSPYDTPQSQTPLLHVPQTQATAQQIMSSPVIHLPLQQADRDSALQMMQQHNIRHLPLLENEQLAGLLTERDLLRYPHKAFRQLMIRKVFVATPDTQIQALAHVMFDEHIGALPIVDEQQQLLGIVTRSDILRALSAYQPLEYWA
jgi:acetoin utilization protein AcuB